MNATTALVYYMPAAATLELYLPAIGSCYVTDLRSEPVPTVEQLVESAEEAVARHCLAHSKTPPTDPVKLEFRVPRDDELQPAAPPSPAGHVGYWSSSTGHVDPGYVASPQPRGHGAKPVVCPQEWFPPAPAEQWFAAIPTDHSLPTEFVSGRFRLLESDAEELR